MKDFNFSFKMKLKENPILNDSQSHIFFDRVFIRKSYGNIQLVKIGQAMVVDFDNGKDVVMFDFKENIGIDNRFDFNFKSGKIDQIFLNAIETKFVRCPQ